MSSQINKTSMYQDLDDDDLDLDLDIENIISTATPSSSINTKVKEASENLFKKPQPVEQINKSNEKNNNIAQNLKTSDLLDETTLNSLLEEDAKKSPIKSNQDNQDVLSQLFENDKDDDDNEDDDMQDFFKNESVIMSTQKVISSKSKQPNSIPKTQEIIVVETLKSSISQKSSKEIQIIPTPKPVQQNVQNTNKNIIVEKSTLNISRTVSNEIDLTKSSKEMLSALKENKMWLAAKSDIGNVFQNVKLPVESIHEYTIHFYFNKFFEKDLLIKNDQKLTARKLPILCAWIKELTRKPNHTTVILDDGGGDQLEGTISNTALEESWDFFLIGSVLILQDVPLVRIKYSNSCYHLNIKKDNLLAIYYLNLEGTITDNSVMKKEFKQINALKTKDLIDKFEELYTNYDYLSYIANTTINSTTNITNISNNKNKSNDQSTFKRKSTSSSNLNSKPAPYQVPNRNGSGSGQAQTNAQFTKPRQPTSTTTSKPQTQTQTSTSQRNFNFKTNSKPPEPPQLNSTMNNFSQSSQSNRNQTLTEEALSQLIFGCDQSQLFDDE